MSADQKSPSRSNPPRRAACGPDGGGAAGNHCRRRRSGRGHRRADAAAARHSTFCDERPKERYERGRNEILAWLKQELDDVALEARDGLANTMDELQLELASHYKQYLADRVRETKTATEQAERRGQHVARHAKALAAANQQVQAVTAQLDAVRNVLARLPQQRVAHRGSATSPTEQVGATNSSHVRSLLDDQRAWSLLILDASTRDQPPAPLPAPHASTLISKEPDFVKLSEHVVRQDFPAIVPTLRWDVFVVNVTPRAAAERLRRPRLTRDPRTTRRCYGHCATPTRPGPSLGRPR